MKNKTKFALLSVAISAAAIGVFGATTFAWFTQRANTKLNFSTATIKSNSPNLSATIYPLTKVIDSQSSAIPVVSAEETHTAQWSMADLSSSFGERFVQKNADGTYSWAPEAVVNDSVVTFGLGIETREVLYESSLNICLNWAATSADPSVKENVELWVRGSIIEYTDATFATPASTKRAWLGSMAVDGNKFMDYKEATETFEKTSYPNFTTLPKNANAYLGPYTTAITKFYKVSFWFEGTVAENQDIARSETVNFSVDISSAVIED